MMLQAIRAGRIERARASIIQSGSAEQASKLTAAALTVCKWPVPLKSLARFVPTNSDAIAANEMALAAMSDGRAAKPEPASEKICIAVSVEWRRTTQQTAGLAINGSQ